MNALTESTSQNAFDEFIQILELTGNSESLKLIEPVRISKKSPLESGRGIFRKLADKFGRSKSPKYPLGLSSSGASPSSPTNSYNSSAMCPLKEERRATLIKSGGSYNSLDEELREKSSFQLPRRVCEYSNNKNNNNINNSAKDKGLQRSVSDNEEEREEGNENRSRGTVSSISSVDHQIVSTLINNLNLEDPEGANDGEHLVRWHPYAQPQPTNQDAQSGSSFQHYCMQSYVSASESDTSSDSLSMGPNLLLESSSISTLIARDTTKVMNVKPATIIHNNSDEDYKMTSRPRGPCLIVNNIDFEGDMFPTRKGSDEDANRFDTLFQQLGFQVIMRRNQTADQMRLLFKEVADGCKKEHDALFIFILSHGSEHGIYGTDGIEVHLESEIISCFDNRNCKALLGKPKVFVIQACRGRSKDFGGCDGDTTDAINCSPITSSPIAKATLSEYRVPTSWLPSQPSDGKKRKHPVRTDMLLIFSCLAGFVSVRNELAGSWLGVALAYFLMTFAHERDLLRILNFVTSDVIQRESSQGHIQSIELKLLGWTKNLYFNPGIYI